MSKARTPPRSARTGRRRPDSTSTRLARRAARSTRSGGFVDDLGYGSQRSQPGPQSWRRPALVGAAPHRQRAASGRAPPPTRRRVGSCRCRVRPRSSRTDRADRLVERRHDVGELGVAADEAARLGFATRKAASCSVAANGSATRSDRVERRVVGEDRRLQIRAVACSARCRAPPAGCSAGVGERAQRLGLTSALRYSAVASWIVSRSRSGCARASSASSSTIAACRPSLELGVEAVLDRGQPALVEPDRGRTGELEIGELDERRASPQRFRIA